MTNPTAVTDGDEQFRTTVRDDELVSEAIVRLVASVDETDPLDLPPLGRLVNPEAINALFERVPGSPERTERRVQFAYHGYTVCVVGTDSEQVCRILDR